jgi:D-glycero-D-manno-heptose 1,7-bisphosphate phosphatase
VARAAVFLDREGIFNFEAGYISKVKELWLIPGAAEAVRQLNKLKEST